MKSAYPFQEVEDIFQQAVVLPILEREKFVNTICFNNPDLITEVLSLLESSEEFPAILNEPVFPLFAQFLENTIPRLLQRGYLGKYKLLGLIGRGGIGAVFLGIDPDLNRKVAVKILPYLTYQSLETVNYFKKEALAISSISHPGVAHIYEFTEENGIYFIVMEYVEGLNLRSLINKKILSLKEILRIIYLLADILKEVHSKNIIHRDIKPENLIYTNNRYLKLLDFGSATGIKEKNEAYQSGAFDNSLVGTLEYLPPEFMLGKNLNYRSDLWSLGVILYELLHSKHPFRRKDKNETIDAIVNSDIVIDKKFNNHPEVNDLILKLLSKDSRSRPQNAIEIKDKIQQINDSMKFTYCID